MPGCGRAGEAASQPAPPVARALAARGCKTSARRRILLQDTFQRAKQWVKELQRQGNPNIVIALAGNKADLSSKRKVEPEVRALALVRGRG